MLRSPRASLTYESRRPAPLTPVRTFSTPQTTPLCTPCGAGPFATPTEGDTCSICLEALGSGSAERPIHTIGKCQHRFHLDCITRCRGANCTTCPLCRALISPGLTPSLDRFRFAPNRGYSPLDLRSDIRTAASRARDAIRARMEALEAAREEEPPTPPGPPPLRFTLTDEDDF